MKCFNLNQTRRKKFDRIPKKIRLGEYYYVWYNPSKKMFCQFIQPTRKGFNFLNLDTSKCILKTHLYQSKLEQYKSGYWFFINKNLKIKHIKLNKNIS